MSEGAAHHGKSHSNRSKKGSPRGKTRAQLDVDGAANDTVAQARAIWNGAISFGLVQIPVSLATAERPNELSFHQLDRRDNSPIGYERINKRTGKKVEWDDIVRGYEVTKGSFVIVTDEDFRKANGEASQTIDIQAF